MQGSEGETINIQACLDRLRAGEPEARDELFARAYNRLHRLAHKMLRSFPGVRRREETDDVFHRAAMRLDRALLSPKTPDTALHFFRLAALQIRRELIDLARHYRGSPENNNPAPRPGQHPNDSGSLSPAPDPPASTSGPFTLAEWTEFHEAVERLPEDERELFRLRFYMGVQVKDIAEALSISERTVKRRWRSAVLTLFGRFDGNIT